MEGQLQMEDAKLSEESLEVHDPTMAALLVNPKAVVALVPFLTQERTLSEAAAHVGMKLPRMAYWVKKFVEAGLVRQTRKQRRAGSAIAYYQSISRTFYVPYTMLGNDASNTYRRRMQADLEQRLTDALGVIYGPWSGAWGLRIGVHPTGDAAIHQVTGVDQQLDPMAFDALSVWDGLRLHSDDAKQLQQDLYNVLERYRHRTTGAQMYLVRIAVAATRT